jgi:putative protein-disulfide isomerase
VIQADQGESVSDQKSPNDPTLIYVFDAMCGWCYGFSPEIVEVEERFEGRIEVEVVSGGLATGDRAVPLHEARGYIRGALQDVEQRTGIEFGPGFRTMLDEGDYHYASLPPARAVAVFREMAPDRTVAFAADVQRALFYDGKPLDDAQTYRDILTDYPVDTETFLARWTSEEATDMALQDFQRAQQLGARGFPTLIWKDASGTEFIASGFMSADELGAKLEKRLDAVDE